MRQIAVSKIIDHFGLDKKEVAKLLFPTNNHPDQALYRVTNKGAALNSEQIDKFAALLDLPIDDLYTPKRWKGSMGAENTMIFVCAYYKGFKIVVNLKTKITKIFHFESLMHEQILHSGELQLGDYLNTVELIIDKYERKN